MKTVSSDEIARILDPVEGLSFTFYFGSSVSGIVPRGSDVDIAVYFKTIQDLDARCEIIGRLQDGLAFEKVDLTVLNTAPVFLTFEALKGKMVLCKDRESYETFFSYTCRMYEDEMIRMEKASGYKIPVIS